jgi:hypothetical protein
MLRLGVHTLTCQLKLRRSRILSVQLDFSSQDNVTELKRLLDGLFGEETILFSLLGNTMANFESDAEPFNILTEQLLRPQDRFLLEVATARQLNEMLAQEAVEKYDWYLVGCQTLAAHVAKFVRNGGGLLIMSTGSGKSLSFALALSLTDPGFKSGPRYPELADDKPVKAIPSTETIDIAVLAKKNITTDVTAALAEGLGITPAAASAGSCNPELIREHWTEYSQTRSGR